MSARKYREIAETLRDLLRQGQWQVGERLPPERALSAQLEVPRATVREALIVLEVEGLVEVRHASGIYVKMIPSDAALPTLAGIEDFGPFELLRARQVLESAIAASAALTVTDEQIARMEEALAQEERDIEEERGSYEGDALFHHLVAEASQNPALIATMELLWSMRQKSELWTRLHTRIFDDGYRRSWSAQHREILNGLRRRDPETARAAMWRHLGSVTETLLRLSDPETGAVPGPVGLVGGPRSYSTG